MALSTLSVLPKVTSRTSSLAVLGVHVSPERSEESEYFFIEHIILLEMEGIVFMLYGLGFTVLGPIQGLSSLSRKPFPLNRPYESTQYL